MDGIGQKGFLSFLFVLLFALFPPAFSLEGFTIFRCISYRQLTVCPCRTDRSRICTIFIHRIYFRDNIPVRTQDRGDAVVGSRIASPGPLVHMMYINQTAYVPWPMKRSLTSPSFQRRQPTSTTGTRLVFSHHNIYDGERREAATLLRRLNRSFLTYILANDSCYRQVHSLLIGLACALMRRVQTQAKEAKCLTPGVIVNIFCNVMFWSSSQCFRR
ncbi:hypothetical protein BKA82DRAFT_711836 [Pisolithus tinctorius]|uniref:Secreted protein n=1 Tax=Pisolithus tinctorius Marx 270 TaxID=870435 RepID=A0A0C3P3L1_PISTI|nr:hypothetical protein BKA82DRAFT_711836 [Pisolithus tinctorius]KIO02061.1 hypothetical protein M404DRAFT_711836 [Pisolithus tinctorius Marx 270]